METGNMIERLRAKLARLRSRDSRLALFGAGPPFGHGYVVNAVQADQVAAKEAELGFALPEEYKSWLLAAGTGAGPDYGLFGVEKLFLTHFDDQAGSGGEVETVAEITHAHITALEAKWRSDPNNASLAISINSDRHLLVISESGCGGYTALVTHGPMRGKIFALVGELTRPETALSAVMPEGVFDWLGGVAGQGELSIDPNKHFTFFDWYENWLDRSIAAA